MAEWLGGTLQKSDNISSILMRVSTYKDMKILGFLLSFVFNCLVVGALFVGAAILAVLWDANPIVLSVLVIASLAITFLEYKKVG